MRVDYSDVARCYLLKADGQSWFLKAAHFPTTTTLVFDCPFLDSKPFLDSLEYGGRLPFREWEFAVLDSSLNALVSYTWRSIRVTRVCFPTLENQSRLPAGVAVECDIAGLVEGHAQGPSGPRSYSAQRVMARPFMIQTKIDGLPEAEWSVSKVDAFKIGAGSHKDLVLTASPEWLADPFRGWLSRGNSPKAGALNLLTPDFQTYFSLHFTSLRVQSVKPAVSLYSLTPGTIRLSYFGLHF